MMLQKYEFTWCDPASDVYTSYLTSLASVQIISPDLIRKSVVEAANGIIVSIVSQSCERELGASLRKQAKLNLAMFQSLAQKDVTASYSVKT